ncbi:MAG: cation-translocating P-type ATPase, partial [Candidatus Colwellbacteria bacterium]|nr:cation-translocating P-type ATPase [Candidatus Colwellbacteria bacterium]
MKNIFHKPLRNYTILALVIIFLILDFFVPGSRWMLLVVSIAGAIPTVVGAAISAFRLHINIDVFNIFALGVAFATGEIQAAAFIVLMLNSAELLDFYTESKAKNAVEKLLALKPRKAIVEKGGNLREIAVEEIKLNDVVVVKAGSFIPVDGIIIFGTSFVNEGSVTGESTPVEKIVGDNVLSSTLNGSGVLKIKAVGVGKESTIERMAALIREAAKNKSRPEKLADRFAAIFLPIVIIIGVIVYLVTKNITMTAAIFLVACADDMAVAVPLATVASIGRAAKRGVIIK